MNRRWKEMGYWMLEREGVMALRSPGNRRYTRLRPIGNTSLFHFSEGEMLYLLPY